MNAEQIRRYHRLFARLAETQEALDSLILATPTSEERNKLTEANILIMQADNSLKEAQHKK